MFLPVCGEPVEVLRNTWTHVARMCHHYPGKVTTYVLDDGGDPQLKAMARRFGFAYATRPDRGWYKKSGNLLFGYEISDSQYILLLDADFAPRPDLLNETLPYLAAYPEIGIVQTPQYFHITDKQTWVERGAGAVQEMFYRLDPDGAGRQGWRDLLRELRRVPPDRAAGQPGHVAGRALGRPAHRLRPAAARLAAALRAGRAVGRQLPG